MYLFMCSSKVIRTAAVWFNIEEMRARHVAPTYFPLKLHGLNHTITGLARISRRIHARGVNPFLPPPGSDKHPRWLHPKPEAVPLRLLERRQQLLFRFLPQKKGRESQGSISESRLWVQERDGKNGEGGVIWGPDAHALWRTRLAWFCLAGRETRMQNVAKCRIFLAFQPGNGAIPREVLSLRPLR